MAIFKPGPAIGQISGRIGGSVFSHNRGGAYIRNGAIPTRVTTPYAEAAKNRLAVFSAAWAGLSTADQLAWKLWATQNPITNRLGDQITLSGHGAYVQLNTTIDLAGGTPIDIPPVVAPPTALLTLTPDYSIANPVEIAYTATPVGASNVVFSEVAISDNPGVQYVRNLFKLVDVSAANQGSPISLGAAIATRFGTLQPGQGCFFRISIVDQDTGLRSQPLSTNGVLTA
mgnify:CR=1 FL=1